MARRAWYNSLSSSERPKFEWLVTLPDGMSGLELAVVTLLELWRPPVEGPFATLAREAADAAAEAAAAAKEEEREEKEGKEGDAAVGVRSSPPRTPSGAKPKPPPEGGTPRGGGSSPPPRGMKASQWASVQHTAAVRAAEARGAHWSDFCHLPTHVLAYARAPSFLDAGGVPPDNFGLFFSDDAHLRERLGAITAALYGHPQVQVGDIAIFMGWVSSYASRRPGG